MLNQIEYIEYLSIMVTGRCNMTCEHCLRGDPVPDDISDNVLNEFFSKTKFIRICGKDTPSSIRREGISAPPFFFLNFSLIL